MTPRRSAAIPAAGALVWKVSKGKLRVLAVHRPRYDDWSWPKGKLDPGETIVECAMREVAEETGLEVVLGRPLPSVRYMVAGREKEVRYWAATVAPHNAPAVRARTSVDLASPSEIDALKWLTIKQAHKRITKPHDLDPLDALVSAFEAGELRTRALIVVRHARAVRRKAWSGHDRERPLTSGGRARASHIVPMLAAFGAGVVISSPAVRCTATVAPYATAAGLDIISIGELTEESFDDKPEHTATAFHDVMARPGHPVISAHRPTLGVLMDLLRSAQLRRRSTGTIPRTNPYLPAGGVLVAHCADSPTGSVVLAVETHLLKD